MQLRQGRENAVAFPMERVFKNTFHGARSGLITGVGSSFLTCANANWLPGALSQPEEPWLLRVTSGTAKGTLLQISMASANTDSSVNILPESQNLAALGVQAGVDSFELIPAHTLNSLFPAGSLQGGSLSEADQLRVWDGSAWLTYYHDGVRWMLNGGGEAGNTVLRPDLGYVMVRKGSSKSFQLVGNLGNAGLRISAPAGKQSFVSTTPRSVTFAEAALHRLPGWNVEPGFPTVGDHVQIWTGTVWTTYYYDGLNWRRQGAGTADSTILFSPGRPVMIKRPGAASPFFFHSSP